jgi:hypothetical protein
VSAERLIGIEKFCPIGMQIKSPDGVMLDRDEVVALEIRTPPRLTIHFKSSKIEVRFHRNVDWNGPPDVYQLAENIRTGRVTR